MQVLRLSNCRKWATLYNLYFLQRSANKASNCRSFFSSFLIFQFSIILLTHCLGGYVNYDNAPGCGEFAIKDSVECGVGAASLGFTSKVSQVSMSNSPPGCYTMHVMKGNIELNYMVLFNTDTGTTGGTSYKSVCRKDGNLPEDASSQKKEDASTQKKKARK